MRDKTPLPEWTADELRNAMKSAGVALWMWTINDDTFVMDEKAYALWEVIDDGDLTFEDPSCRPGESPHGVHRNTCGRWSIRDRFPHHHP
jgi:hypothetical protein